VLSSLTPVPSIIRLKEGDLLQMAWYVSKMPRKQYQLWKRPTETLKQYKRDINGVNSVRLYAAMHGFSLEQLAVASGKGVHVLERTLQDTTNWPASRVSRVVKKITAPVSRKRPFSY
jgi:hypothetical protein